MNTDDQTVKIEGKLDTYKGTLSINILDVLQNLNDESKQDIISDGGWWSLISKDMAHKIVNEFSRESYNEEYTKLRSDILNSESMPSVIREWAKSILQSLAKAKEAESYWSRAYHELWNWTRNLNRDSYEWYQNIPKTPAATYYATSYSTELMKEVEDKIREWESLFPEPSIEEEN